MKGDVLKEYYIDKAKAYLTSIQHNLEEIGGLENLWHERTKMMPNQEKAKLGNELGITAEGKYGPSQTLSLVKESARVVAEHEGPYHFKSLGASVYSQSVEFEKQVDNLWTAYALNILNTEGIDAQPPSSDEIAQGFKDGKFDEVMSSNQKLLNGPENNLLNDYNSLQAELAASNLDMGQNN